MTWELYLAYVVAAGIVLALPGPTVLLVMGYALAGGRRTAWHTVPGVIAGDATALTVSLAGLGAVLAASATLFGALKWVGAAYLVYLGVRMWRRDPEQPALPTRGPDGTGRRMTAHAYVVTALNPKSIAFFVAFLPHFMVASAPMLPQAVLLAGTFLALAVVENLAYLLLASGLRRLLHRPGAQRTLNRIGGGVLVSAGVMTAALRRAA